MKRFLAILLTIAVFIVTTTVYPVKLIDGHEGTITPSKKTEEKNTPSGDDNKAEISIPEEPDRDSTSADNETAPDPEPITEEPEDEPIIHSIEEYTEAGVNEMKSIPILMYHRIYDMTNAETSYVGGNVDVDGYGRTAEAFEADLERFYEWGYRAIRLTDYVDGIIDTEFGKSPVILTFDDGMKNAVLDHFDESGEPVFAKNCAVDVLERVKERHPDFNVTATFFLNGDLFGNGSANDKIIIQWMVDHGYDIGNHLQSHPYLPNCSAADIQNEVGRIYEVLESIIPGRYVNIIALPYGEPMDTGIDTKYDALYSGTYNGKAYTTRATLLCSWTMEVSPFSDDFNPHKIKRIRGYDNNGLECDIEQIFSILNSGYRYVSDGDPNTVVYPSEDGSYLIEAPNQSD